MILSLILVIFLVKAKVKYEVVDVQIQEILQNFLNLLAVTNAVTGGAATCMMLLLVIVIILVRKVKEQRKTIEMTNEEIDEFMRGVPREKANAKGINELFVLPYDTSLEVPRTDVSFCKTCRIDLHVRNVTYIP